MCCHGLPFVKKTWSATWYVNHEVKPIKRKFSFCSYQFNEELCFALLYIWITTVFNMGSSGQKYLIDTICCNSFPQRQRPLKSWSYSIFFIDFGLNLLTWFPNLGSWREFTSMLFKIRLRYTAFRIYINSTYRDYTALSLSSTSK